MVCYGILCLFLESETEVDVAGVGNLFVMYHKFKREIPKVMLEQGSDEKTTRILKQTVNRMTQFDPKQRMKSVEVEKVLAQVGGN